jgi:hypothetical protein
MYLEAEFASPRSAMSVPTLRYTPAGLALLQVFMRVTNASPPAKDVSKPFDTAYGEMRIAGTLVSLKKCIGNRLHHGKAEKHFPFKLNY